MNKWFANPVAAILLVVSNLVPLAGVLFWDWFLRRSLRRILVFVPILYNVCVEVVALAPVQWWVAFMALALSHGGRIAVAVAGHVGSPEARDGPLPSPA